MRRQEILVQLGYQPNTMLMNIHTGSVSSALDWAEDCAEGLFPLEDFSGLVPVVKDSDGDWVEAE